MALKTLQDFKDEAAKRGFFKDFEEVCEKAPHHIDIVTTRAAEQYAEYMAIEFTNWIDLNCDSFVEGGYEYDKQIYSVTELYKLFKEENK